ncbi:MAG: S8 family peptidase [Thermoplasmata archaeon]
MNGVRAFVCLGAAFLIVASGLAGLAGARDEEKARVIVLFKEKVDRKLIEDNNGEVLDTLTIIPAAVAKMGKDDIKALKKSDKIKAVEEDAEASICGDAKDEAKGNEKPQPPPQPNETTPWGVDRIDADLAWSNSTGSGVKVAILDTGIDRDHPDLKDNIKGGVNIINSRKSYEDDNGHGTHCAGIIAAVKNKIGVVGVAHSASIYAVKVLNSQGNGFYSDIIKGIQWCINNGIQVISMSLGGSTDSSALKAACDAAKSAGIVLVAAAGNDGGSILYPAAYESVIAVGAVGQNNDGSLYRPDWSNYGDALDLVAPGVDIYSTYKGDTYKTLSGTSMACPHVSGTAALVLATTIPDEYDSSDNNDKWDPDEVQNCLQDTADKLGETQPNIYFGHGLVDAEEAVTGIQS